MAGGSTLCPAVNEVSCMEDFKLIHILPTILYVKCQSKQFPVEKANDKGKEKQQPFAMH